MALQKTLYEFLGISNRGNSNKFFKNEFVFTNNFIPDHLIGRKKEIDAIAKYLKNVENTNKHMLIFGKTGTGKTVAVRWVMNNFGDGNIIYKDKEKIIYKIGDKKGIVIYLSCRQYPTRYRVVNKIAQIISESDKKTQNWSKEIERIRAYSKLLDFMIIILDEIDYVDDKDNLLISTFSRWGEIEENTICSLVLISNKIHFLQELERRAFSSFQCLQLPFYPYNAEELQQILEHRAKLGIKDGVLDDEVIPYISAIVSRESGDARQGIGILKLAVEIAGIEDADKVVKRHVDIAKSYGNLSVLFGETITSLPYHERNTLKAIALLYLENNNITTTGDVYKKYKELVGDAVTQRRIADYISDLTMLDIISAKEVSRGRYGRTRIIDLKYPPEMILEILKDEI